MLPEGPKPKTSSNTSSKGVARTSKQIAKREKPKENYGVYIYKILKQIHPETEISSSAMSIMSSFINEIFDMIATESSKISATNGTLSSREIQQSVQTLLTGELAKHAVSEGTRVIVEHDPKFPLKNFENSELFSARKEESDEE